MSWNEYDDEGEFEFGSARRRRRSPFGDMPREDWPSKGAQTSTAPETAEDEVRSQAAQLSSMLRGEGGAAGRTTTTTTRPPSPAEELARQRQEQLTGRPPASAAPPAATQPFEEARAEQRDLMNRSPLQPTSPLAPAQRPAAGAPGSSPSNQPAQVLTGLLRGEEEKSPAETQSEAQGPAQQPETPFDVQGTFARGYTSHRRLIGNSVDNQALYVAMGREMSANIDAAEKQVMALFAQYNQAIDPATQAALQQLREQTKEMQKEVLEGLNARGMAQSGIVLEMQDRLNKNQLTASQQLLAGRLSEVQNRMLSAVMEFAKMKLQTSQTFALAGLQAAESAADRAQRGNLAALQGGLGLTQMGLSADQFNRQMAEQGRQFNVGQGNWQQQFGESQRQFSVGQGNWQQQFGESQREFNVGAKQWGLDYDFRVQDANRNYELRKDAMTAQEQAEYQDDMMSVVDTLSKGGSLDDILPQIEASATSPAYQAQLKSFATNYYQRTPQGWLDTHGGAYRSKDELLDYLQGQGANTLVKLMGLGPYQQLLTLAQTVPEGYYPSGSSYGGLPLPGNYPDFSWSNPGWWPSAGGP